MDFIKVLHDKRIKRLSLFEFLPSTTQEDLYALIKALQFNRYFQELYFPPGALFPFDLLDTLVAVLLSKNALKEISFPSTGLTSVFTKKLSTETRNAAGQLQVATLDLSGNPLEDKGVDYLGTLLAGLNYGLSILYLSNLSVSRSMEPLCAALRKNSHFLVTLTILDLSSNSFDQESSGALGFFLAQPNMLEELNLSMTGVVFDKIADAFNRGCVTNLRRLFLSNNKIATLDKLATFATLTHSLNELDLSYNPLDFNSLFSLVRNIMVNTTLFDFTLILRSIGLNSTNGTPPPSNPLVQSQPQLDPPFRSFLFFFFIFFF